MTDKAKTRPSIGDIELEEFRQAMEVPSTFEEGFNWSSMLGALFVALLMVPGAVYMGLLAGVDNIGVASQWVTVILFIEVAKRAQRSLRKAEIFVLFFVAAAAMGLPFYGLLWNQFFIQSDAAIGQGISEQLPAWFAPPRGSESYAQRTFFHVEWLPVIGMIIFTTFFSQLSSVILGYGLFRLTSDVEKLPFPMAPVGAQGIMAMAEDVDKRRNVDAEPSWRWRVFSIGGAIGLAFGAVYLLLPTLSGALTGTTIQILPIPFSDYTGVTGRFLPAVATGIAWDLGNLIFGMVMPFFGMLGGFIAFIVMAVANPVLYHAGILESWQYGDDTVVTLFKNNVDFYFSLQIGLALAIAIAGIWQVVRIGRDWHIALFYTVTGVITYVVVSRLLAETGVFFIRTWFAPCAVVWGFMGANALGPDQHLIMAVVTAMILTDPREAFMPFAMTGICLADRMKLKISRTTTWGLAALLLALAVALPATLYVQYRHGSSNVGGWWFTHFPVELPFNTNIQLRETLDAQDALQEAYSLTTVERLRATTPLRPFLTGFGIMFVVVIFFAFMRYRFAWWPFHPLIFLVLGTWPSIVLGPSFLLGWMIKSAVTRFGGARLYRNTKPLMIGLIAGDMLAALITLIVGAIYYANTGRPPMRFLVTPT